MNKTWRALMERNAYDVLLVLGFLPYLAAHEWPLKLCGLVALAAGGFHLRRLYRQVQRTLMEKHIPFVAVVGDDEAMADKAWSTAVGLLAPFGFTEELYRTLKVDKDDLLLHYRGIIPENQDNWIQLAKDFQRRTSKAVSSLEGRVVLHVFVGNPGSLALAFGAGLSIKDELVVYKQAGSSYRSVADLRCPGTADSTGAALLRVDVKGDFQFAVAGSDPVPANDLYVSVQANQFPIKDAVEAIAKLAAGAGATVSTYHITLGQQLPPGNDWVLAAREIVTLIRRAVTTANPKRTHLFVTASSPLNFMIGLGIGPFTPITVYNYCADPVHWHPVVSLEKLALRHGSP